MAVPVAHDLKGVGKNKGVQFSSGPRDLISPRSRGIYGYETAKLAFRLAEPEASFVLWGVGHGVLIAPAKGLKPGETLACAFHAEGDSPIPIPKSSVRHG